MSLTKVFFTIFLFSIFLQQSFCQIKSINTSALVAMMEGSFSSEEQSKNDSDYYDIRLHMKRIWPELSPAYWLYVEQATAEAQDKPYRQRVYRITNTYEGRFESAVFTITDPLRFAGEWKKENPLSELNPDSLTLREGCSVILTLMNDTTYEGSTEGNNCLSDLRGAKYATSEVKITSDKIISWDRGYDEEGKQVWGAVKGGYVFKRRDEQ
ncbi:MAG: chromophore lyase CpcT/CpeT [Ignavibacteria bacterium]|nr:chromophore lyase CpcT/CpeT [Ignavibacteria bacterium]